MLSQHALRSIISISKLHGISYSGPKTYKKRREKVREGGRQSGCWLYCHQHSKQAKNAQGTCSSWLVIRRCLKSPLTPLHHHAQGSRSPDHHDTPSPLRSQKTIPPFCSQYLGTPKFPLPYGSCRWKNNFQTEFQCLLVVDFAAG